jgi:hypothetical protein
MKNKGSTISFLKEFLSQDSIPYDIDTEIQNNFLYAAHIYSKISPVGN